MIAACHTYIAYGPLRNRAKQVCKCVCVCVCVHICMYVHSYDCCLSYMHCIWTFAQPCQAGMQVCVYICMYAHAYCDCLAYRCGMNVCMLGAYVIFVWHAYITNRNHVMHRYIPHAYIHSYGILAHIYIYIYIYIYSHTHRYTNIHIYTHTGVVWGYPHSSGCGSLLETCMHISIHTYTHIYTHRCCLRVSPLIWMWVASGNIHTYIHTYTHI